MSANMVRMIARMAALPVVPRFDIDGCARGLHFRELRGALALVLWLDRFQIRPEEAAMEARFGSDYVRYKVQASRWT